MVWERDYSNLTAISLHLLPADLRELHHARTSWCYIGLQLKESVDTLDGIREQFKVPDDCLREAITHWLKQMEPTWRVLVNALKTHSVGEGQLAGHLERERCSEWSESCRTEEPATGYKVCHAGEGQHTSLYICLARRIMLA